ncbi:MAG: helix-turn-helix transcriptional regulator [Proteobacteria bacterium]|nr:helix-turn-helix transcriptional regulator [Pseudomonadota bacterium]
MVNKLSREGIAGRAISELAERVRATRKRHGLTQTQLAGLSGTGLRFISELERGKPTVTLDKVVAVLSTLGLQLRVEGPES